METRNKNYDSKFLEIKQLGFHPHMIPFVGCEWDTGRKLLLIAESCGIPLDDVDKSKKSVPRKKIKAIWKNWYTTPSNELTPAQIHNTDIKNVFEYVIENNETYGVRTYDAIKDAMLESCGKRLGDIGWGIYKHVAFANFYLRPSLMDKGGKHTKDFNATDADIGNEIIGKIVDIIKPNFVYILSSAVKRNINKDVFVLNNIKFGVSCHPSTCWWNRRLRNETKTGKEKFKHFLDKHKIFK
jgi:hypothetical protein